jgi:hypothetical protein
LVFGWFTEGYTSTDTRGASCPSKVPCKLIVKNTGKRTSIRIGHLNGRID